MKCVKIKPILLEEFKMIKQRVSSNKRTKVECKNGDKSNKENIIKEKKLRSNKNEWKRKEKKDELAKADNTEEHINKSKFNKKIVPCGEESWKIDKLRRQ